MPRTLSIVAVLTASVALAGPASANSRSEVVDLPRPEAGEYLGLYLSGKKIGYTYLKLGPVAGNPDQFETVNEFVMKAMVGQNKSERYLKDTRVYEAKP